ncbi:hypothetical protein GA0061105_11232 [Rhizobium aethiopicum]|uniref:Uncharacterized protein n=1 Tax=Rhizobium aethiopicum TaxID=1138170 RepID=A0A1C3Y8B7_9HYPH|nr:hypothetical protein GA0061105_11232 [Rhizobium aethiopicum]
MAAEGVKANAVFGAVMTASPIKGLSTEHYQMKTTFAAWDYLSAEIVTVTLGGKSVAALMSPKPRHLRRRAAGTRWR